MKRTFGCTLSPVCAGDPGDDGGPNEHPGDGREYTAEDECTVLHAPKRARPTTSLRTAGDGGGAGASKVQRRGEEGEGSPELGGPMEGAKRVEELNTNPNRSEVELEAEVQLSVTSRSCERTAEDVRRRAQEGGCLVAEGYEEVLTFLGTLVNEFRPTNVSFPSAILIGSRAAYHWDDTLRMPATNDWNLIILPWALENWLACNQINVSKPESGLKLYEYVLPNPRLPESVLPNRQRTAGQCPTINKAWRVSCTFEKQVLHFEICGKYLYERTQQTLQSSNCLLFEIMSKFMIVSRERTSAVKQFPGGGKAMVAPLVILEAIKRSHVQWPGNSWHKHMSDMHALRNRIKEKCNVNIEDNQWTAEIEEFVQRRYCKTEQRLGIPGKQLGLFTNWNLKTATRSLSRHRELHRVVKKGETPFYEELQQNHVLTIEVFNGLRHESKLKLIREELMTLTLERRLDAAETEPIPFQAAYADALERFCTVCARGTVKQFVLDHYPEFAQHTTTLAALCLDPEDMQHGERRNSLPKDSEDPKEERSDEEDDGCCPVLDLPERQMLLSRS